MTLLPMSVDILNSEFTRKLGASDKVECIL